MEQKLTDLFPHFILATKNWCEENNLATHILCATQKVVGLPEHIVKQFPKEIDFNISSESTPFFEIKDGKVHLTTRFNGVSTNLSVPLKGIIAVHCPEVGVCVPNYEFEPIVEDEIVVEKPKTKLRLV